MRLEAAPLCAALLLPRAARPPAMANVGDITTPEPQPLAGLEVVETFVEAYLSEHRVPSISWHTILNNHSSTRPKEYGGKVVQSVKQCKTSTQDAAGAWSCDLDMPNSFAPGDGLRLQANVVAPTKREAEDLVCRQALARLLLANPSQVLLRPGHWTIGPSDLLGGVPGVDPQHQALPVHVPARLREAGAEAAGLSPDEVDQRVAATLRKCLETHGGQFDPSAISHKAAGLGPGDQPLYARLNSLLPPGQLRAFVDRHPAFSWRPKNPAQERPGMIITWATPSASGGPVSASAGPDKNGSDFGRGGARVGERAEASGSASAWRDQTGRDEWRGWSEWSGWAERPASGAEAAGSASVWPDQTGRDEWRGWSG